MFAFLKYILLVNRYDEEIEWICVCERYHKEFLRLNKIQWMNETFSYEGWLNKLVILHYPSLSIYIYIDK